MWSQLVELQPQTSKKDGGNVWFGDFGDEKCYFIRPGDSGGGISRDQFIDNTASDILKRIPQKYDIDKIRKKYGLDVSPTTVVLLQELERFNRLTATMYRSLATLKRVSLL